MSSRLQNRCLVGSCVAHGTMVGILVLVSAFKPRDPDPLTLGVPMELISNAAIEEALTGLPSAAAAPETPAAPAQAPQQTREPEPEPAQPPPEIPKPQPRVEPRDDPPPKAPAKVIQEAPIEAPESEGPGFAVPIKKTPEKKAPKTPPKDPPKEAPKFDFKSAKAVTPVDTKKKTPSREDARPSAPVEDPAKARARALAGTLASAAGSLERGGGSKNAVSIQLGGGGTGSSGLAGRVGSANALSIRNAYFAAWVTPPNVSDDLATVETEVTIRRDGAVVSARIVRPSGIAALDRSIDDTLKRVRQIVPFDPFPDEKLEQQAFKIGFNLRARRQF